MTKLRITDQDETEILRNWSAKLTLKSHDFVKKKYQSNFRKVIQKRNFEITQTREHFPYTFRKMAQFSASYDMTLISSYIRLIPKLISTTGLLRSVHILYVGNIHEITFYCKQKAFPREESRQFTCDWVLRKWFSDFLESRKFFKELF